MSAIQWETSSVRVNGLCFHLVHPWICVALHDGDIQIWDYESKTEIRRFSGAHSTSNPNPDQSVALMHNIGHAARSVDFHPDEPLMVSCGDDRLIKVWNIKTGRCLYTIHGHLDVVRTVQFHPNMSEVPWILSASDDQTVRLWDLERRTCVHVFTGHNHHVTCAAFHPTENLIVSASLDKTVRVWDTSRLVAFHKRGDYASGWARRNNVLVKYVLEGHERGVNWASFHPTLQILVSGSEDRRIKFWQLTETKAWEIFSLDRHIHSVTSCIFRDFPSHQDEVEHLDQLEVVSCSEDGRVCVFKVAPQKWHDGVWLDGAFRQRDDGRFWALAAHPTKNLVAAGHDSGFILFQLGLDGLPSDNELPPGTLRTSDQSHPLRSPLRSRCRLFFRCSIGATVIVGVTKLVGFLLSEGLVLCSLFSAAIGMILVQRHSVGSAYFEVPTEEDDSFLQHHSTHMLGNAEQGLELAETDVYTVRRLERGTMR